MFRQNAIALAMGSLSALAGCSALTGPERATLPPRAGTVEPVVALRHSSGVDSEAMYRIGRYYQGQARHAEALAAYRKALALDPGNVDAQNGIGVMYSLQGMVAEADAALKAAIAMAPGRSYLHGNLGYHYLQTGRASEARIELREAIRLSPANALAWRHLAIAEKESPVTIGPGPWATASAAGERAQTPLAVTLPQSPPPAPTAQLLSLAPNVWQLRPRVAEPTVAVTAVATAAPAPAETVPTAPAKREPPESIPSWIRIEVSNGNGVTALAQSVSDHLESLGARQARLTNQKSFDVRHTEIQYVPAMEDWARDVKLILRTPAQLVEKTKIERDAHLRVVLGKDFHEIEAVAQLRRENTRPVALAQKR